MDSYKLALITGATDGIGKAYAYKFAKKNINIILVARTLEKLENISKDLKDKYSITVEYYSMDLSTDTGVDRLSVLVCEKKPDILVNSAGFGRPGRFCDLDFINHKEMLNAHVNAIVRSTYSALSYMKEDRCGLIINVSSLAGLISGEGYTMYGSTKLFIKDFSDRLAKEVKQYNIYVQALCPGFTYTGFHDTSYYQTFKRSKYPKFLWQSAESVVEESLNNTNKSVLIPRTLNRFIYFVANTSFGKFIANKSMKSSKPI